VGGRVGEVSLHIDDEEGGAVRGEGMVDHPVPVNVFLDLTYPILGRIEILRSGHVSRRR
jgi:hypothetical protein